jgi:competence ComEA-like helix-hairpin-helix protein
LDAEGRSASAALLLGAVVMGIAMPPAPPQRIACDAPFERSADARSGFTTEVGCGTTPESRRALRGPARLLFGMRLDLNRATAEALQALPAIGPARADAIVRARADRRFEKMVDLERVPGIGRKTSEGLHAWVAVTSEPASAGEGGAHAEDEESQWTDR